MSARAFYTGCLRKSGHYFWINRHTSELYGTKIFHHIPDFISSWEKLWDGGLLKNGKHPDVYDGKVFAVPAKGPWIAFVWWDNSVDERSGSNSGFYVSGFEWSDRGTALAFAMQRWPEVVERQRHPLVLQFA